MDLLHLPGRLMLDFLHYLGQLAALISELSYAATRGAFTGAVFTFQCYMNFKQFGVETGVGAIVSVALCRELGPVLAGLMVAGRVGASMAADIGTMKVTEQIDALRVMGVDPVGYLVLPRFVAMLVSMPLLIAESITFGLIASYIVTVYGYEVPAPWFMGHMLAHTNMTDLNVGMIKGFVFGILITLISCHQGLAAKDGAVGVGIGTTRAVVISSLALLIVNFFLSVLLNYFFPMGADV
jgi:phospholipid/cholesterol/gamma-HCH transport system permease protein